MKCAKELIINSSAPYAGVPKVCFISNVGKNAVGKNFYVTSTTISKYSYSVTEF
jgi:hypothetical protein